jgi:hypothetical protein
LVFTSLERHGRVRVCWSRTPPSPSIEGGVEKVGILAKFIPVFLGNSYLFKGMMLAGPKNRPIKRGVLPTNCWVWGPNSRFYWS